MSNKTRGVMKILFQNFVNSLKPRQFRGNLMGEDYFGNKFFEIPADPSVGRRKASRWFEPKEKDDFEQEMAAEWEAWLRGRRKEVPKDEEILKNYAIMQMKKRNAAALDEKYGTKKDTAALPKDARGKAAFPQYEEYEYIPGVTRKKTK